MSSKFFSQALWRNKFGHDLSPFSTSQKYAVLEVRAGHFRGFAGFEAKDLIFKATAKDFKLCPRGLHFWLRP